VVEGRGEEARLCREPTAGEAFEVASKGGLLCWLLGHDWYLIAKITGHSRHVGCNRCGRQWGMNDDARALLPWSEVADFHAEAHGYLAHQTAEERDGH
jgi:hypothetical protein